MSDLIISEYSSHSYLHLGSPGIIPLNAELNPFCHLLALLGAHHILYFSRVRVKICHILLVYLFHVLYITYECSASLMMMMMMTIYND